MVLCCAFCWHDGSNCHVRILGLVSFPFFSPSFPFLLTFLCNQGISTRRLRTRNHWPLLEQCCQPSSPSSFSTAPNLRLFWYVCIYVYIHHACTYMYIYICVCVCVYTIHTYCMYTFICIYILVYKHHV